MKDGVCKANFCGNLFCEIKKNNFEPIIASVICVKFQK